MEYKSPDKIPGYEATGHERLERLAAFIERLPADRLTFTRWYGQGKGCAIGLAAAMDPWFQAQGLRLEQDDSLKDCRPVYRGDADWRAVVRFFQMRPEHLPGLFDQTGYDGDVRPHPKRVADKIRSYLAQTSPMAVSA